MSDVSREAERELSEQLREEWEALGLMSYHGGAKSGVWYADLAPEDVGKIRALLAVAATEHSRLLALVEQQEKALREIVALATWGTDNRMAARSIAAAALSGGSDE